MGGGASKIGPSAAAYKAEGKSHQDICRCLLPVYYTNVAPSDEDRNTCLKSWELVTHNTAPAYLDLKEKGFSAEALAAAGVEEVPDSALTMFFKGFYARLFDVHPECEDMFTTSMQKQGGFLTKMISLSLTSNPITFKDTMIGLAEAHNRRGVKAVEYGVVGDVLFWTLRHVLGLTAYTNKVHNAWVRIFSAMLEIIVPVAVAFELESYKQEEADKKKGAQAAKEIQRRHSDGPTGYHKPLGRQQTGPNNFKGKVSAQEALYMRNVQSSTHSMAASFAPSSRATESALSSHTQSQTSGSKSEEES